MIEKKKKKKKRKMERRETLRNIERNRVGPPLDQCFNPLGRVGKTKRKKTGLRRVL